MLGRTFRLNGHRVTVVGEGPQDFVGTTAGFPSELWLPLGAAATVEPSLHAFLADRGARELFMIARLRPGATVAGAGAGLDALAEALGREYPESDADRTVSVLPASEVRLHPAFDVALFPAAAFVMGVVVLVLLVGCSNLANLLLVRSTARRQEIAVRRAWAPIAGDSCGRSSPRAWCSVRWADSSACWWPGGRCRPSCPSSRDCRSP